MNVQIERRTADIPYSALYTINLTLIAPIPGEPALITLRFAALGQTFEKRINQFEGTQRLWLAVNTHLLPNGPNVIELTVEGGDGAAKYSESFTINVLNDGGLAEPVRNSLSRSDVPLVFDGLVDAGSFGATGDELSPWYDRPSAFEHIDELVQSGEATPDEANDLRSLVTNGYVQLTARLEPTLLADANAALDDAIASRYQNYEYGSSQRLEQLHQHYEAIHSIWKHPLILRFVRLVFAAEPLACQTLGYVFGSEQSLHQDTIHLTSFPPGYMCGVWVALQDIKPNSGELEVVPGSHRFERVYRKSVGCDVVHNGDWSQFARKVDTRWKELHHDSGLPVVTYRPTAGSILIWLDSLLHGGSPRIDRTLTRRSIVSHYFASGSVPYYDSTGLPGYVER